ncbi:hypothetical protein ACFJIX_24115 [Roseateles sp. UC29_93]|uniref:hypothetical protein n=1 Tax=Roseateles sp. UC29_93 TaxID=3350177 RepID=UPI003671F88A
MTSEVLAYWLAGICPPAVTWILNMTLRGRSALLSSAADSALLFLVFDGASAISIRDVVCNTPNEAVRALLPPVVPALIFVSMAIWMVIVRWLEPLMMVAAHNGQGRFRQVLSFLAMWWLVIFNAYGHYFLFVKAFHVA